MADENDKRQEVEPAEQAAERPAESRVESRPEPPAAAPPPLGAQPPAGAQPPVGGQPPVPPRQPPAGPEPALASGGAPSGRARGWTGRRSVQLLAAGVAGMIVGGGAVALLDVLDDDGERPMYIVPMDRGGPVPFGPGWRRWQAPGRDGRWDGWGGQGGDQGDFPPGGQRRPFAPVPQPSKVPEGSQPVPSASPGS